MQIDAHTGKLIQRASRRPLHLAGRTCTHPLTTVSSTRCPLLRSSSNRACRQHKASRPQPVLPCEVRKYHAVLCTKQRAEKWWAPLPPRQASVHSPPWPQLDPSRPYGRFANVLGLSRVPRPGRDMFLFQTRPPQGYACAAPNVFEPKAWVLVGLVLRPFSCCAGRTGRTAY